MRNPSHHTEVGACSSISCGRSFESCIKLFWNKLKRRRARTQVFSLAFDWIWCSEFNYLLWFHSGIMAHTLKEPLHVSIKGDHSLAHRPLPIESKLNCEINYCQSTKTTLFSNIFPVVGEFLSTKHKVKNWVMFSNGQWNSLSEAHTCLLKETLSRDPVL